MILGETASWEDSQLQLIAKDHSLLQSFQTLKYINVALLVILVYDHCLTFNLEKTRIWTLRWATPKYLFMINRYLLPPIFFFEGFSNVFHVGQNICDARIFTPLPAFPAIMTVELMLILRVLALYENSKLMARYLIIQFFVQVLGLSILAGFILSRTRSIAGQGVFTGCLISLPEWSYLSWIQPLIVELILVILIVYRCRKYGDFSPTTKLLARDSIVYFVSITAVLLFNLIFSRRHTLLGTTLTMPTSVLACIAASRLSMNIRSISMGRAFSTLAEQSRFVPTLLFRGPESVSYDTGDGVGFPDVIGPEGGMPEEDDEDTEDNRDRSLELEELSSTIARARLSNFRDLIFVILPFMTSDSRLDFDSD